ncbi:hypothetical protein FACS189420_5910 [Bacteroidia bacterium]|nr:hypothetical protein FACS189420_5910 [Bacteroidia bacterium]
MDKQSILTYKAKPEAWNILMSVLDINQRYLRLDEEVDSPTVFVAQGLTFMATALLLLSYSYILY